MFALEAFRWHPFPLGGISGFPICLTLVAFLVSLVTCCDFFPSCFEEYGMHVKCYVCYVEACSCHELDSLPL